MKKIIIVATILTIVILLVSGTANALTVSELQQQIADLTTQLTQLQAQLTALTSGAKAIIPACINITFTRTLSRGSSGADVKCLQALLNTNPATQVAATGAGSPGQETTFFGTRTQAALKKYQDFNAIPGGTGRLGPLTRVSVNNLLIAAPAPTTPTVPRDTTTPDASVTPPTVPGDITTPGASVTLPTVSYTLTTTTTNGSVTKSPNQTSYASGTIVTLTATANTGYQFSGWSGDLSGTTNPTTITMNNNKTVTAGFTAITSTNYYVRQGATGNGSGSDWTNAYGQLPATLQRGATYYIADGTYPRYTFDDPVDGTKYITIKKATESDHGPATDWDRSYGDGQAVFSWMGGSGLGAVLEIKTSYWEINGQVGGYPNWTSGHGFKITTDNPQATLLSITYNVTSGPVASNIRVYRTEFAHVGRQFNPQSHANAQSVRLTVRGTGGTPSAGGHHFAYNYFHDNPVGVFWTYESGDLLFEYNIMDTNAALEPGSSNQGAGMTLYAAKNNIIRYNIFKDIEGSLAIALYTWHGTLKVDDIKIYGNVFYYSDGVGRSTGQSVQNAIIGTDADTTGNEIEKATNIKVYNNTFSNIDGYKALWIDTGMTGNEARNNIFYKNEGVKLSDGEFKGFVHSHNWFYGNTDYRNGNPLDNDWSNGEMGSGQVGSGNPFIQDAAGNFRLTAPTAAGITLAFPYDKDAFGSSRGADGNWDRGAYEFVGAMSYDARLNQFASVLSAIENIIKKLQSSF